MQVVFWVRNLVTSRGCVRRGPKRVGVRVPCAPLHSRLWPEPGGGAWRAAAGRASDPPRLFPCEGGWGSGRWRLRPGAGLWARLGPSAPTDRRRRPRRAVLCPRRSRRGWPGPVASTTLRAPREERPPGPAPLSPPPLRRRGPETIRLTAKRSKRDPRNWSAKCPPRGRSEPRWAGPNASVEGGRLRGVEEEPGRLGRSERAGDPGNLGHKVRAGPGPGAGPAGPGPPRCRKGFPGPAREAARVGSRGARRQTWRRREPAARRERGKMLKRSWEFPLRELKRTVLFFCPPCVRWLGGVCGLRREPSAGRPAKDARSPPPSLPADSSCLLRRTTLKGWVGRWQQTAPLPPAAVWKAEAKARRLCKWCSRLNSPCVTHQQAKLLSRGFLLSAGFRSYHHGYLNEDWPLCVMWTLACCVTLVCGAGAFDPWGLKAESFK